MNPSFPRLLADVFALFRREADIVLRVAGALLFLPALAVQLLCDPIPPFPPTRDQTAMAAWLDTIGAWGQANAGWYVAADAIGLFGTVVLAVLLLDPARPDVSGALLIAGARFGRFVLASLLVALPVGAGLLLIYLPGLWMQARLIAVIPALAGAQPLGARASLARSWRITAGAGWAITAAIVTLFLAQMLAAGPLVAADDWLRQPAHDNPFLIALVGAGLAAVATAYRLALLLLGVVVYRRLANSGT